MFHRWCCMLWIMSCSMHSPYFFFPSFWYRLILISAVQKMLFQKWFGFCRIFFFWQSLIWPCLHLVVNPLFLLSWSLLLIVDFDSDTPAPWRVFSWMDVVKGVFFTTEMVLQPSTTVVLCGHPGLFVSLSSVHSFFFSQNVPNCWFGHS